MKRIATTVLTLAIAAACGSAIAQNQGRDHDNSRSDVARVTRVEQIDGGRDPRQQERVLRQECWNTQTNRNESGYYRDDQGRLYQGDGRNSNNKTARTVIGAIIGGALGNQVGDGRGQTAATIAGAAAGAAIGSKSGRDRDDRFEGYDRYSDNSGIERRCRTVTETVDGRRGRDPSFRVSYRYAGQDYQAFTNYDPGRNIRVVVDVRPEGGRRN